MIWRLVGEVPLTVSLETVWDAGVALGIVALVGPGKPIRRSEDAERTTRSMLLSLISLAL